MVDPRDQRVHVPIQVLIRVEVHFVDFFLMHGHLAVVLLELVLDSLLVQEGLCVQLPLVHIVLLLLLSHIV